MDQLLLFLLLFEDEKEAALAVAKPTDSLGFVQLLEVIAFFVPFVQQGFELLAKIEFIDQAHVPVEFATCLLDGGDVFYLKGLFHVNVFYQVEYKIRQYVVNRLS